MTGDRRDSPHWSSDRRSRKNRKSGSASGDGAGNRRRSSTHRSKKGGRSGGGDHSVSAAKGTQQSAPSITDDRQVTDGRHAGRRLPSGTLEGKVPLPGDVRRELFSVLGKRVRGGRFLDLCAGTGMAGIEAISRGASLSSFVERKAKRCSMIRANLKALGIKFGHGEIFEEEIAGFLKRMAAKRRFWDNVFFDPPFEADYDDAFRFFSAGAIVRNKGLFAIRHHSAMFFPEVIGVLRRTDVASFAEQALSVYQMRS